MFVIEIEKIVPGGFGLGRMQGKVIFVPYTIPGEQVCVERTVAKKDYEIAQIFQIFKSSSERIHPICPYFSLCGGCQFHHMEYATELGIKKGMFQETLQRTARITEVPIRMEHASAFAYRNRVRFHIQKDQIGFLAAKGTSLVPIDRCIVCVGEVNQFLQDVKDRRVNVDPKGEVTVFGYGGQYFWEGGTREVSLQLMGKQVSFPVDSFFQSNMNLLEHLIRTYIIPMTGSRILELYGGVGTFGVFLQHNCSHYTMVEEYPPSVRYAVKNLGGGNIKVVQSRVEGWISPRLFYDTVVLDPPRTGLSAPVRNYLKRMAPKNLLYISCNPVTFARDLRFFLDAGYEIESCTLYDFYPRTTHLEVVCQLVRP